MCLLLGGLDQLRHFIRRHPKDPREQSHPKRLESALHGQHQIGTYLLLLLIHGPSAERHPPDFVVDIGKAHVFEEAVEVCGDAKFSTGFVGGFVDEIVVAGEGRLFGEGVIVAVEVQFVFQDVDVAARL